MKVLLVTLCLGLLFLTGCEEGFIAGVGTGLAVKVDQANKAAKALDANIEAVNEKAKELEILIKTDPMNAVAIADPNLKTNLDEFIGTLNSLASKAEEFQTEEGKIDWERVIYASIIGLFGGGTAVNLYKNRKAL